MYTVESYFCNSRLPNGGIWYSLGTLVGEETARTVAQGYVVFTGVVARVCKDGRPIATYGPKTLPSGTPWVELVDTPSDPVVLP